VTRGPAGDGLVNIARIASFRAAGVRLALHADKAGEVFELVPATGDVTLREV